MDIFSREWVEGKVQKEPTSGCWLWTGSMASGGYARFSGDVPGRKGRQHGCHRVSYELFVGKIPEGKMVLHRCDVRLCVNPGHLYVGDAKDNSADMHERGRAVARRGNEGVGERELRELIKRAGLTKTELASRLGRSKSMVSRWGRNTPGYVLAYLRQLIELNRWRP